MTRVRQALLVITGLALLGRGLRALGVECVLRNAHDPARHPLGGFRCRRCSLAGADLDSFGGAHFGQGYVRPVRKVFGRPNGEVTRTPYFEPSSRGTH